MNCNGQRVAKYVMLQLNSSNQYEIAAEYTNEIKNITTWNVQWLNEDPLDTPTCGYDMSLCPRKHKHYVLSLTVFNQR